MAKKYQITTRYDLLCEDDQPEPRCDQAHRVVRYMDGAFEHPDKESFWVIILDRRLRAKGREMITLGTQSQSLAHPREVFRTAIREGASSIICVHNHPSGDPSPSRCDIAMTRMLCESGKTLDIEMLDHVIIGERYADPGGKGYFSFREAGLC